MEQMSVLNRLTPAGSMDQEAVEVLVQRLRQGDRRAAEALVDRFYRKIYLYLRELGLSQPLSEDLTQETFLRAWSSLHQLHEGKAVSAWLYRIASNAARQQWRREKTRHRLDSQRIRGFETLQAGGQEELSDLKDQYERLLEAIGGLNWKHRQAIVLHYLQELSIAEAASIVGVREGTMKSRLSRALDVLRTQLSWD